MSALLFPDAPLTAAAAHSAGGDRAGRDAAQGGGGHDAALRGVHGRGAERAPGGVVVSGIFNAGYIVPNTAQGEIVWRAGALFAPAPEAAS